MNQDLTTDYLMIKKNLYTTQKGLDEIALIKCKMNTKRIHEN